MLVTTTDSINGKDILDYLGIVSGESVAKISVVTDMVTGLADAVNKTNRKTKFSEGRDIAMDKMKGEALKIGANAVVGVHVSYETAQKGVITVIATGTAVKTN